MVVEKGIHHACPQLPRSLWEGIFCRLDINSITNAAASCRDFSVFATSDFVWQQLYQRDWSCCENAHSGQSAASVLGAPARLLDAQSHTECIVAQAVGELEGMKDSCPKPSLAPCPALNWRKLYQAKKALEANWQAGRCTQRVLLGHRDYIRCLDLHTRAGKLVSASGSFADTDCSIRVWDLKDHGQCRERLVGHQGPIWSMQSDGERFVASVGDDGTLRLWDLHTHRVGVSRLLGPERLCTLGWDLGAGQLAAGNAEGVVAVWSLPRMVGEMEAWADDDEEQVGGEEDRDESDGDYPVWQEISLDGRYAPRTASAPQVAAGPWPSITCLQLEGGLMATGEGGREGRVHLWTVPPSSQQAQQEAQRGSRGGSFTELQHGHCTSSLSSEGSSISRHSSAGSLRSVHSSRMGEEWEEGPPRVTATLGSHSRGVSCLGFWREGGRGALAVGSVGGELKIWDMDRCSHPLVLQGHRRDILCMQLGDGCSGWGLPGDGVVVTGSADKTVRVWDARAGHCVRKLHLASIPYSLQMGCGRLAAGCSDGDIQVWDLRGDDGRGPPPPPITLSGHKDRVWALALDESNLVSASLDGSIHMRSFLPGGHSKGGVRP